jgi:hypothetical protein
MSSRQLNAVHLQVARHAQAALLLLLVVVTLVVAEQTAEPYSSPQMRPRTFGPLFGGIGTALLEGLSGLLTDDDGFGPLAQHYIPPYSPFPFVNRPIYNPYYGQFNPYGLYGYGNPTFGYPFFRNARHK